MVHMKRIAQRFNFGFTLVELMVVVSIIGILTSIVYANFGDSRKIARDNVRKTDLKDLQVAIELYKAQNGRYPGRCLTDEDSSASRASSTTHWSGAVLGTYRCNDGSGQYILGLVPDYIASLPEDPMAGSSGVNNFGYLYEVDSTGASYKLMAYNVVEKILLASYDDEFARCATGATTGAAGNCPDTITTVVKKTYAVYKGPSSKSW